MNKQQLASLIWDTCNDLRGSISAVEYTMDISRAKAAIEDIEGAEIKPHRVVQKGEEYLKRFILSGGRVSWM